VSEKQPLQHFLLVYDHTAGRLLEEIPFGGDSEAAVAAYAEKEREYGARDRVEIVLIGSDSIDTIKVTHANYFTGTLKVSKVLAGLDLTR
jgi:hypothetical protein